MRNRRLVAKVSTSFRLTPEQNDAVRAEAARRRVSISRLLEEIIDEWMLMRSPTVVAPVGTDLRPGGWTKVDG